MPVQWLAGFTRRDVTNRYFPRRSQLGRPHSKTVDTIVLHSTEGTSASGAFAAYDTRAGRFSGGVHPHVTVDPVRRLRYQHIPMTAASYSLLRGDTDGVIQIEIVGFASKGWTDAQLRWLGSEVIAPIRAAHPKIPLIAPAPFLGPSAGTLARPWPHGKARMSPSQWAGVAGIVGHQHAPYDDHWDPGPIRVDVLLDAARPAPAQGKAKTVLYFYKTDVFGLPISWWEGWGVTSAIGPETAIRWAEQGVAQLEFTSVGELKGMRERSTNLVETTADKHWLNLADAIGL